jgi:NAD(P)-dependent dehydrogenase (short-subunit alcohol dehydrogenase family)
MRDDREMTSRILVTGATGGVGEALVRSLAARGDVILAHARSAAALEHLVTDVQTSGGNISAFVADLSSLDEVVRLARHVGPIDVLINNAGVGFGRDRTRREESRDGFEMIFAVNYLAPFLLTETLTADKRTGAASLRTIVNVASAGQAPLDEADLMLERPGAYEGTLAYRRSKLALIMDTFDRARRDPKRAYVALHPGTFLATKMVLEAGIAPLGTAEDGAAAVQAVLDQALAGKSGVYFDKAKPTRANAAAYDQAAQERLRKKALALVARA